MAVEMSAAEFQPQADELAQVLELLKQSQISDNAVQREVQKKLEELKKIPTFSYYLLYVLTRMTDEQQVTRSLGGLILKNNIHAAWSTYTDEAKRYVKAECVHALGESNQMVRTTVDVVIASILSQESIHAWPDLVVKLLDQLHSDQDQVVVGAFSVVQKICEDSAFYQVEDREYALRTLMPALVGLLLHQNVKVRLMCLQSVNFFLGIRSPFLDHFIDDRFLARLFNCMNDSEQSIHDCLCQALSLLCNLYFNKLTNYMPTVARYILHRTSDSVEHTALEACEFWLTLAEEPANCREVVRPYLAELIPVLVRRMRYSEQDLRNMKADLECDELIPDRTEDIQPRFRRSKPQQQQQDANSMSNVDDGINNIHSSNRQWMRFFGRRVVRMERTQRIRGNVGRAVERVQRRAASAFVANFGRRSVPTGLAGQRGGHIGVGRRGRRLRERHGTPLAHSGPLFDRLFERFESVGQVDHLLDVESLWSLDIAISERTPFRTVAQRTVGSAVGREQASPGGGVQRVRHAGRGGEFRTGPIFERSGADVVRRVRKIPGEKFAHTVRRGRHAGRIDRHLSRQTGAGRRADAAPDGQMEPHRRHRTGTLFAVGMHGQRGGRVAGQFSPLFHVGIFALCPLDQLQRRNGNGRFDARLRLWIGIRQHRLGPVDPGCRSRRPGFRDRVVGLAQRHGRNARPAAHQSGRPLQFGRIGQADVARPVVRSETEFVRVGRRFGAHLLATCRTARHVLFDRSGTQFGTAPSVGL
ncbi:transportin-1 [Trichinella spiralis]|uniref:transportin-1 n=1 Tax=Trichinella spiralis TaxID=6334 RepID=UPI0001EFC6CC|nr:transportin-1 [Trichinella spiralis]